MCLQSHTHTTYRHTQTQYPFSYMSMFSHTHPSALPFTPTQTHMTLQHTHPYHHTPTCTQHTHAYIHTHAHVHTVTPIQHTSSYPTPKMQHIHPHTHTRSFTSRITSEATEVRREFFFIHERLQMQPPRVARTQTLLVADSRLRGAEIGQGGSMFPPPVERQVGNEAQETQEEESAGRWRHDPVPGRKESAQSLKPVKQSTHQPLLTERLLHSPG